MLGGTRSKSANLALSCQPECFVLTLDIDLKSIRIANGVPCPRHRIIVRFKKREKEIQFWAILHPGINCMLENVTKTTLQLY